MSKTTLTFSLLVAIIGVWAAGCTRPVPRPTYDLRLIALDPLVEDYIQYISHRRVRLPSGQLNVIATFRNIHRNNDIAVDWKFVYYDQDGFQLEETEWNTSLFPRAEEYIIKANSIARNVTDFLLKIRSSKT